MKIVQSLFAVCLVSCLAFTAAKGQLPERDPAFIERELIRRDIKSITCWNGDEIDRYEEFDRAGRIVKECGNGWCKTYRYDERGKLLDEEWQSNGGFSAIRYEYDRFERISRVLYSSDESRFDEQVIRFYRYDSLGRIQETWRNGHTGGRELLQIVDSTDERIVRRFFSSGDAPYSMMERRARDGERFEQFTFDSNGTMTGLRLEIDDGCRHSTYDTTWRPGIGVVNILLDVIDTCARLREQLAYSRFVNVCAEVELKAVTLLDRVETILDEHGRPLQIKRYTYPFSHRLLFENEDDVVIDGSSVIRNDLIDDEREGEELRETETIVRNEEGLVITRHIVTDMWFMPVKEYRYEYEFFAGEEEDSATIR